MEISWPRCLAVRLLASLAFAMTPHSISAQGQVGLAFSVDVGKRTVVDAETALRTNVVAYADEYIPEYIWRKFFKEQRVGDILLDTTSITRESSSLDDIKARMRRLDALVSETVSRGGRVQLVFQNGMPRWLSSAPDNDGSLFEGNEGAGERIWQSVPPSDYARWEEIVATFVHHFNKELDTRGRVYYILGNEPETYWVGSEREFHEYYRHFVLGARKADPLARVGGINPSSFHTDYFGKTNPRRSANGGTTFETVMASDGNPILYNWLRFAASQELPVDVVTWHDYPAASPVPSSTANWVVDERLARRWLSELGFSGVELILDDWPEWKRVENENDSEFQAAYVASGLISMLENGTVKPLYLGLIDIPAFSRPTKENASFGGGTGLFTIAGLAKPVYNAYALFSKMRGQLVHVRTGDDFVSALATVEDDAIYVLVTNFIPSRRIILHNTYGIKGGWLDDENRAAAQRLLENSGMSRHELFQGLLDGSITPESLGLPRQLSQKVNGVVKVARAGLRRARQVANVSIELTGIQSGEGRWTYDEYVVDKHHANSYSLREKIAEEVRPLNLKRDRAKLEKMREEVNTRTGVDSGRTEHKVIDLRGSSYRVTTALQPDSVHLIVLRRHR